MNNTTDSSVVFQPNILEAFGYIFIFITSFIGNIIVIIVVKRNMGGKLRSVSYYLIFSLAVADLFMAIGNVPERITRSITSDAWLLRGDLGIAVCKLVNFVEKMAIIVSVSILATIAVDRFLNVFVPHRNVITTKICFIIIGIIWSCSAIYCLPILVYANLLEKDNKLLCKTRVFFPRWTLWFLPFLVILFVSLFFVFVLYLAICIRLCFRKVPGTRDNGNSNTTSQAQSVVNRKVAKMVAAIVIAFYLCFLPYWLSWIFCSYHFTTLICNPTYSSISVFLSYANISLNPIIYVTFSENFREGFKSLFRKACAKQNRARVHPGASRARVDILLAGMGLRSAAAYHPSALTTKQDNYRMKSNKNKTLPQHELPRMLGGIKEEVM